MTGFLSVLTLLGLSFFAVLLAGSAVYSVWRSGERGEA